MTVSKAIIQPVSKPSPSPRQKRIALLLALVIVLLGANLLYAAIADGETMLTGAAGELLYAAAFDGFADEWDTYQGQQRAEILEGRLELGISAAQTAGWSAARPRFADFDITVQATAQSGPVDNAFGIVFRMQSIDREGCDLPAVALCGIDRVLPLVGAAIRQVTSAANAASYYAFFISSDGYYSVRKTENGREAALSAWIAAPMLRQGLGAQNTLRVIGRGADFQFFINGEPVMLCIPNDPQAVSTYANGECIEGTMQAVLHDDSIAAGRLGVIARATPAGGGGIAVQFDNVIVFSPADNPSDEESRA